MTAISDPVLNPTPGPGRSRGERRLLAVAIAAWLGYGVFLAAYFVPAAGASDQSGYMNSARLFAQGRLVEAARPVLELHAASSFATVPLGFIPGPGVPPAILTPTYPSGVPLQFAALGRLFGMNAGLYLACVGGAMAAVWFCYGIARELGVAPGLAVVGAAMLALDPVFAFIAIQPLSDVLATTWAAAAVYAALRGRRRAGWCFAAGAAAAMAVLVRPTNVLVFPVLAVVLGRWRGWWRFALGGLPGAVWLLWYQGRLYGDPLRSGYGDIWELFHASNLLPTLRHYLEWLPRFVPWVILLGWVGAAWGGRRERVGVLWLGLWALPVLGFYACYDVTQETWWCLRFILPALPPMIIAGVIGVEAVVRRFGGAARERWLAIAAAGVAAWFAFPAWHWWRKVDVTGPSRYEGAYITATAWVKANLPPDSAVACMLGSGSLLYYTDLAIVRWDMISADEFRGLAAAAARSGRPVYALLFVGEEQEAFAHLPGRWEPVMKSLRAGVWKLQRSDAPGS